MSSPPNGQSVAQLKTPDENPPPYHDWTVIPDTSLLPPPPALRNDRSTNNASWDDAARAHRWCDQNPLYTPSSPPGSLREQVQSGDISVQEPPEFKGSLKKGGNGLWKAKTKRSATDCILLSLLPLYFAKVDSPLVTGKLKTIYFEVRVLALATGTNEASGIAIGFCATPYPSWRLPGWHRASLGIHGDDGRRFVNDPDGGIDFTRPFKVGETVGIGMEFHSPSRNSNLATEAHAEVFFTRNGQRDIGWHVNEERDLEFDGTFGLEGNMDLYAGIGVFGGTEFDICFAPEAWMYQPSDLT